MTRNPDGKALAILMSWQGDFEQTLEETRGALLTWVLKDVQLGEFAVVEATYDKSLGRVVAASGKAIDRLDGKPVEFTALRIQNVDEDHGAAAFGAWKDAEHKKQIAMLMASIRIEKPMQGK